MNDEQKKAAFDAINQYSKERYDKLLILVPKGDRERYKELARARGMSLSELARAAIDAYTNGQ